ncbi:MAG: diaminopimelate decarboxylase [Paludibacteraceae bacterium]|nr:diaminopimelate decarboxylase [Paludibacteraceae bacterium]
MTGSFPIAKLAHRETPFYYYDTRVLRETLAEVNTCASVFAHATVHYAVKACATSEILRIIAQAGLGADCVSGGEIQAAIEQGVTPDKIVFAGVAKTDREIRYALEQGIACFNVESQAEVEVIDRLAAEMGRVANVCLRINPNIDAHTHAKITTGMRENKFGIQMCDLEEAVRDVVQRQHIAFKGLHFHIGSQITDMQVFAVLAERINELVVRAEQIAPVQHINVGGGLGILYEHPNHFPIPDFRAYFDTYRRCLHVREDQTVHFELGRSIVAQCGNLMTRVLYVKKGVEKQFAIVDAGMTDLIRPALYGAFHRIENISNPDAEEQTYDIVGPICESSDVFVEGYRIAQVQRGDLLAIRSAGAYGEVMASRYNLRRLPGHWIE